MLQIEDLSGNALPSPTSLHKPQSHNPQPRSRTKDRQTDKPHSRNHPKGRADDDTHADAWSNVPDEIPVMPPPSLTSPWGASAAPLTAAAAPASGLDRAMRPTRLSDFTGQAAILEQLSIATQAASARGEPLDHTLFYGPPGLGKTTLSGIIAHEMGGQLHQTSGPVLEKPRDIAALLTGLNRGDVLFIDEIHRMPAIVEELLFSALEDFQIDIMVGEGPAARSIRLPLEPFTLVGATTRLGLLSAPLRDRFGITCRLELYSPQDMQTIFRTNAARLGLQMDETACHMLSHCARGTPRIANRLLRRVRDVACVLEQECINATVVQRAMNLLQIQPDGLDEQDWRYLHTLQRHDGPVGLDTLAAMLGEDSQTIEDTIEPYLLQQGLIQRTPRGRTLTAGGQNAAGKASASISGQLF